MTVKDLIAELEKVEQGAQVGISSAIFYEDGEAEYMTLKATHITVEGGDPTIIVICAAGHESL